MIQSPLNYTGGKYKLLPQLLPHFPQKIHTFVDLFCGGCNVGINVTAEKYIYSDTNEHLLHLCNTFKNLGKELVFQWIYQIIEKYDLSMVSRYGYAYYGCDSVKGLSSYNKPRYLKLRADFNARTQKDACYYYIMLYVIVVYAFNNQIRFNRKKEFNLPVGKRDFNGRMQKKLADFIDALRAQDATFLCLDFREFDLSRLRKDDFVYVDPPYLITCATYNEQGGWNEDDERDLLDFLDRLSAQGIRFALSNVLRSKGKENTILCAWVEKNAHRYHVIPLQYSYANASYHTKDKVNASEEVVIINGPMR